MRVIAYSLGGVVCVVHPVEDLGDDALAALRAKDVPEGATNVVILDRDSLPSRATRATWRISGDQVLGS